MQRTSLSGVFAAGRTEYLAAVGERRAARETFRAPSRWQGFAVWPNQNFQVASASLPSPQAATAFCRCAHVPFTAAVKHGYWQNAKLQPRYGVGSGQCRIWGEAAHAPFGWNVGGVHPPVAPTSIGTLIKPGSLDTDPTRYVGSVSTDPGQRQLTVRKHRMEVP